MTKKAHEIAKAADAKAKAVAKELKLKETKLEAQAKETEKEAKQHTTTKAKSDKKAREFAQKNRTKILDMIVEIAKLKKSRVWDNVAEAFGAKWKGRWSV